MLEEAWRQAELKNKVKRQWDQCALTYSQRMGYELSPKLKSVWMQELANAMGSLKKQKVLDVGTGPGFLAMLYEEMGHECIGVDFSEEMIKSAREQARKNESYICFHKADAEALPFDDNSFDVVTNRHLIWTLTNPQKAMDEWVRVLKPGGRLIIFEGNWIERNMRVLDQIKSAIGKRINQLQKRRRIRNRHQDSNKNKADRSGNSFDGLKEELPLRCVSPEKLEELMRNAAIKCISQQDIKGLIQAEIRARPLGYRLSYNKNRFLIVGQKEKLIS